MAYTGGFMLIAVTKIVDSTFIQTQKYAALVLTLSTVGMLMDGYNTMMQNFSRTLQNACWFGPTMLGTFCLEIFFIPVNFFIGLVMNIVFTIMRVITATLFPLTLSLFQFLFAKSKPIEIKTTSWILRLA